MHANERCLEAFEDAPPQVRKYDVCKAVAGPRPQRRPADVTLSFHSEKRVFMQRIDGNLHVLRQIGLGYRRWLAQVFVELLQKVLRKPQFAPHMHHNFI